MIKLATRSFVLYDADDMMLDATRAIIEAYEQARREIPMPYLTHVEKRITNSDVSFVLTFDSAKIRDEIWLDDNALHYIFEVPKH